MTEKASYLLNYWRNFNEIFREDVIYDNTKSHKTRVSPLFRTYIFRKATGKGSNWPPAVLGLSLFSTLKYLYPCCRCAARYKLAYMHARMTIWGARNVSWTIVSVNTLLGAQKTCTKVLKPCEVTVQNFRLLCLIETGSKRYCHKLWQWSKQTVVEHYRLVSW